MRVALTTLGVFHSFELARELDQRQQLAYILSPFPWRRLQREGLPGEKVRTFPWIATPYMALHKFEWNPEPLMRAMQKQIARTIDDRAAGLLRHSQPPVDILVALSSTGLKSGRELQQRGGQWICDRGSTHIRFAEQVLREEFARWKLDRTPHPEAGAVREEQEYAAANYITVPSTFAMRTFVLAGIPAEKLRVIPYGVRLESFTPAPQPAPSSLDGDFNVLFAGQLSLRKGVPSLLEAFAALKHPRKRLRLAGFIQHDLRPVLDRLPKENVEFLSHQSQSELVKLMQQAHCLVLPSLEEGLALVQGQALACGCPVIATPNTGAEDLFTDGVEGILVPPRDTPALTAAMQQIAENPHLQLQMREAALRRVQTLGGWTRYGQLWEEFLQSIAR
jgi:glycosyltransferase involved in cell wall biosynthesis